MNLASLPPEIIETIISWMSLSSALSFADSCRRVRTVSANAVIGWTRVLEQAASIAGVHMRSFDQPGGLHVADELAGAGASSSIPPRAWVLVLPLLSRLFVLHRLELPRLTGQEWEEVCERSQDKLHSRAAQRKQQRQDISEMPWADFAGLQVIFLIAHRKSGLTRNRQALREFNPRATFEDLRLVGSKVVAFTVPAHFVPVDMVMTFLVSIGQSTFLTNKQCSKVLESFGFPFCQDSGDSVTPTNVLGPVMIFAEARSLDGGAEAVHGAHPTLAPLSLDLEDFFQVCGQRGFTREWWEARCDVKDGMGFGV
ncbi:hypothetical protein OIV83_001742 [Microbotryomycetes sp. JL201]|nr:hypothetical protein OIV83_001742 [Microbotryomycetes sp. JL201]